MNYPGVAESLGRHGLEHVKWRENDFAQAFLVDLDISDFTTDVDPDELLNHRMRFFHCIELTRLFPEARDTGRVKVHFLGDELGLAFLVAVGAGALKEFVDDVMNALDRMNSRLPESAQTRIKGVVLEGRVTWRRWHGCLFLNGGLPSQAQKWMNSLARGEVAMNAAFRRSLKSEGIPVHFTERDFSGETGYMLRA